jgi:tetratricopeptide (TPR) repeat protein
VKATIYPLNKKNIMGFYKKLLMYRMQIALGLFVIAGILAAVGEWEWFWLFLPLGLIAFASHLMFGPIRFIQDAIQAEDMEAATKLMKSVKFPGLLIKPVRQGFYMLQSNMAMMEKDFTKAETLMKKSMKNKSKLMGGGDEGSSYLQLGMIALQNGNPKEAKKHLKMALSKGLPDNDSKAAAYLQLSSMEIQARQIKVGREYFKKAKALKPKAKELKSQIAQMDKYIHRVR